MIDHTPLDDITRHVDKLRAPSTKRGFRLVHWRSIIRLAQEEYSKELEQLESLNNVKADPATEVPV